MLSPIRRNRCLRVLLASCSLALLAPTSAHAHGDPASHYLEMELLYPSFANRPSQALELRLLGLLQASERRGYPIKVALVGSEADLVENPAMLRAPQRYAEFVAFAIESALEGPVVIVTPHGLGIAGSAMRGGRLQPLRRPQARALVRGVAISDQARGDDLVRAAMTAVRRIARAGGHPLPPHVPPATVTAPAGSTRTGAASNPPTGRNDGEGAGAVLLAVPAGLAAVAGLVTYRRRRARARAVSAS